MWCTQQDGSKLVGAMAKGKCNKVEELRGCDLSSHMMKRTSAVAVCLLPSSSRIDIGLVKITPNLRIIEISQRESDVSLPHNIPHHSLT